MDLKEAIKKVSARKPKDNYMVVTFGYEMKLVIPHKDGLAFIAALSAAEQMEDPYQGKHRINYLDRSKISVALMSGHEYDQYKIAAILDITVPEVKEMMLQDS